MRDVWKIVLSIYDALLPCTLRTVFIQLAQFDCAILHKYMRNLKRNAKKTQFNLIYLLIICTKRCRRVVGNIHRASGRFIDSRSGRVYGLRHLHVACNVSAGFTWSSTGVTWCCMRVVGGKQEPHWIKLHLRGNLEFFFFYINGVTGVLNMSLVRFYLNYMFSEGSWERRKWFVYSEVYL